MYTSEQDKHAPKEREGGQLSSERGGADVLTGDIFKGKAFNGNKARMRMKLGADLDQCSRGLRRKKGGERRGKKIGDGEGRS